MGVAEFERQTVVPIEIILLVFLDMDYLTTSRLANSL